MPHLHGSLEEQRLLSRRLHPDGFSSAQGWLEIWALEGEVLGVFVCNRMDSCLFPPQEMPVQWKQPGVWRLAVPGGNLSYK